MQHLNGLDSKFAVEFREANQQGATAPGARRVNVARVGRAGSPRSLGGDIRASKREARLTTNGKRYGLLQPKLKQGFARYLQLLALLRSRDSGSSSCTGKRTYGSSRSSARNTAN